MGLEHKPEFNKKQNVRQGSFEDTAGFLPEEQTAEEDLNERMKKFAEKYGVDERAISIGSDGSFLIYGQPPPKHLEEKDSEDSDINNLYNDSEEYKRKHPFDRN